MIYGKGKKTHILFFILFVFMGSIYGQEDKKSDISFNTGLSIPIKSFEQKKYFSYQGFANTGFSAEIDYSTYFWTICGINFKLNHANFSVDKKALTKMYNEILEQKDGVNVKAGWYSSTSLMFNPMFDIPIYKFNLQFKAGLGISLCSHPFVKVTDADLGKLRELNSDLRFSIIVGYSWNINYWINEKKGINIEYGKCFVSPDFIDTSNGTGDFFNLNMTYKLIALGYVIKF